jgi:hypothetical protein
MSLTRMLTIADPMPSHTGFASPFLAVDDHLLTLCTNGVTCLLWKEEEVEDSVEIRWSTPFFRCRA